MLFNFLMIQETHFFNFRSRLVNPPILHWLLQRVKLMKIWALLKIFQLFHFPHRVEQNKWGKLTFLKKFYIFKQSRKFRLYFRLYPTCALQKRVAIPLFAMVLPLKGLPAESGGVRTQVSQKLKIPVNMTLSLFGSTSIVTTVIVMLILTYTLPQIRLDQLVDL